MITRFLKIRTIYTLIPFSKLENPHDNVIIDKQTIFAPESNETGYQRLKKLFQINHTESTHSLIPVIQACLSSFIMGGIYGGIKLSRITFINFIETNEATKFKSHFHAKRELRDKMHTSFFKGFVKFGTKTSIFCTSFIGAYTIISEYQNKESVLYYSAAGMYAGAVYKFPLGPKGILSGAIVGSFFGSIYGCFKFLMFKIIKLSELELKEEKILLKKKRDEQIEDSLRKITIENEKEEIAALLKDY